MKNPCSECIVDIMCKEGCEELVLHLKTSISRKGFTEGSYWTIADWIRNGIVILVNNDSDYKYLGTKEIYGQNFTIDKSM